MRGRPTPEWERTRAGLCGRARLGATVRGSKSLSGEAAFHPGTLCWRHFSLGNVASTMSGFPCANLDVELCCGFIVRVSVMLQLYPLRSIRSQRAHRGGLAGWRAKRVAAFVEANIGSSIRVRDLARIVLLSSSHFCRAFKRTFGETPLHYVARQRMRRAQAIMLCSRESLAKIAVDCGMCDQAHFSRVFRRIVGVNPGAWRSRVRASATAPC